MEDFLREFIGMVNGSEDNFRALALPGLSDRVAREMVDAAAGAKFKDRKVATKRRREDSSCSGYRRMAGIKKQLGRSRTRVICSE